MTYKQLLKELSEKTGMDVRKCRKMVQELVTIIAEETGQGADVVIDRFGVFHPTMDMENKKKMFHLHFKAYGESRKTAEGKAAKIFRDSQETFL